MKEQITEKKKNVSSMCQAIHDNTRVTRYSKNVWRYSLQSV